MEHRTTQRRQVRIAASGEDAEVAIDGVHIDNELVEGYSISQLRGQEPQLVLQVANAECVVFDGMAQVATSSAPDPGPAAASFLSAIDAGELERTALARPDLGTGPHSLTRAMLVQLQEWACGL